MPSTTSTLAVPAAEYAARGSSGTLGPGEKAVLPLPAGVSLADYPVVDISAEPYDGDPTHSTDSVVRGTLPA